jgi:flagellar basal-body rod protein FlgG
MIRGLYVSADGMLAQTIKQDVLAANLANVGTAGYRKDTSAVHGFRHVLSDEAAVFAAEYPTQLQWQQPMFLGVTAHTDFSPGSLEQTGNAYHFALEGDGFFAVETSAGTAYTRAGTFMPNQDGELVTSQGNRVLGDGGPIQVRGASFVVGSDGQVTVDGKVVDHLKVVAFADPSRLQKAGASLFTAPADLQPTDSQATVRQGFLEGSNVNAIEQMVAMITGLRAFEANQRAITAQDETLKQAVTELGHV